MKVKPCDNENFFLHFTGSERFQPGRCGTNYEFYEYK